MDIKKKVYDKLPLFYKDLVDKNLLSINFGWRVFRVDFEHNLYEDDQKCFGLSYMDDGRILLEINVDDETARETFLHEIFHVICDIVGLDTKGHDEKLVLTNEELVTRITKGLLVFCNLNPELAKIIL